MEQLFELTNLVLPFWLLMIALPTWRWTERIIRSPLIALPPALIYALVWLANAGEVNAAVSPPQLDSVAELLSSAWGATLGWAHFLAFDLLVGRWAYLDGRERRVHPVVMAPVLFAIFWAGPIGYLLHLGVRALTAPRQHVAPSVTTGVSP